ncbi:MAG: hypothetical protein EA361_19875 [Bacteroidetes bacterium]|nr:MAG: hypothetical protein EA361_19875 [Bacteroidota bacterium]
MPALALMDQQDDGGVLWGGEGRDERKVKREKRPKTEDRRPKTEGAGSWKLEVEGTARTEPKASSAKLNPATAGKRGWKGLRELKIEMREKREK